MNNGTVITGLILSIGIITSANAQAQAPDCNPNERACFDVRIDLPVKAEGPRRGYRRPTTNRYQGLETRLYRQLRMDRTPYTCSVIGGEAGLSNSGSRQGTDVEHIVALAEAHDSGLKPEDMLTFSSDPLNLTVAMPRENRNIKGDKDAADYLPEHNGCWFAGRVLAVKQKWGLSVDAREARFLKTALAGCTPRQIARPTCDGAGATDTTTGPTGPTGPAGPQPPPVQTFRNCASMRAAGWTRGVNRNGGTYRDAWDDAKRRTYGMNTARDRDKDGRACEG